MEISADFSSQKNVKFAAMKQVMYFTFCVLMVFCISSCHKQPVVEHVPNKTHDTIPYPLKMVWESYHTVDTMFILSGGRIIEYKDRYIIYDGYRLDHNEDYFVIIYDKKTGKRLKNFRTGPNILTELQIADRYLIVPSLDGTFIYDMETLKIVRRLEGKYDGYVLSIFGDAAYINREYGHIPFADSSSIIRLDIPSLQTKKILTVTEDRDGGYAALNNISHEIRENGDTIFYGTAEVNPKRIFCYNETKGEYDWITIIPDPNDFYWSHPLFDSTHVYITSSWGLEAYDKETGKRVWRVELPDGEGGFRGLEPLLVDGKLYVKESNYHLYCIRGEDGKIIWHNKDAGTATNNYMPYYNGMIYYVDSGNEFFVIDMKTGKILFRTQGPYNYNFKYLHTNKWARFAAIPPLIDAEHKRMYLADRLRMFCFELWEP